MSLIWLRPLVKYAGALLFIFSALNGGAAVMGQARTPNPALMGFGDKCAGMRAPCWLGITPGVTDTTAMEAILIANGYIKTSRNRYAAPDGDQCDVQIIELPPGLALECRKTIVRVGDLITTFGEPVGIVNFAIDKYLIFDGLIEGWIFGSRWFNPYSRVYIFIRSQPTAAGPGRRPLSAAEKSLWGNRRWHGFVPYWRYCQLETGYIRCSQFPP